jgi:hypothetical protein
MHIYVSELSEPSPHRPSKKRAEKVRNKNQVTKLFRFGVDSVSKSFCVFEHSFSS